MLVTAADLQTTVRSDWTSAMITAGLSSATSPIGMEDVIAFSLGKKLPTAVDGAESVALGGLMSYELYWDSQMQRTAGASRPGDRMRRSGVSPLLEHQLAA